MLKRIRGTGNLTRGRPGEEDWGKGKQVMPGQEMKPCNQCGRIHSGLCRHGTQECYGCGATDHKIAHCP